jgi:hypothetical protein
MSSADARMWADMVERVNKLEETVKRLVVAVEGEDVSGELYGPAADHAEDRRERAELAKRAIPGRPPPGPRAA